MYSFNIKVGGIYYSLNLSVHRENTISICSKCYLGSLWNKVTSLDNFQCKLTKPHLIQILSIFRADPNSTVDYIRSLNDFSANNAK
jgi:hypothetical protein